ncbi:hypothetical protein V1264_005095 [Littorina saxatilis]|uniref:Uncharacterized protein n=3 Tax=Littorina saxatilis TaxID=31220 RepID=A0AAN9AZ74_9CAEN
MMPDESGLTQQQVIVISVAGGSGALLVIVLVVIIYTLVCNPRRRPPPHRYASQISVARSDFWPFSTVQSPPPTLLSPDSTRHVFFKDSEQGQGQHTVLSRSSHKHDGPRRAGSLATLERGSHNLTSLYRHRSRSLKASESGLVTSLYAPFYMELLNHTGTLVNPQRQDLGMKTFNREALQRGRDPFLWRAGRAHAHRVTQ